MKRFIKKDKGVSEVIGTLLILTITVVLFSSVFYYVATAPPPQSKIYSSFQASYFISNQGFANITIKNIGGEALNVASTNIIFIFTNASGTFTVIHPLTDFIIQLKSSTWNVGSSINYNSSVDKIHVTYLSGITLYIIDKKSNSIVWQDFLSGAGVQGIKIIGLSYSPVPIKNPGMATFNAFVIYNTQERIPTVILDLRSMGLGMPTMNYNSPFQFSYTTMVQNVKAGTYPVWVNASEVVNSTTTINAKPFKTTVNVGLTASQALNISSIKLSTQVPSYLSSIKVTVNVFSTALQAENFQLLFKDIYNGKATVIKSSDISSNPTSVFTIYPYTGYSYFTTWANVGYNYTGSSPEFGPHQLKVEIVNTNPSVSNGSLTINFTVLPRILVVDGENNPSNITSYYAFDLGADDFSYTILPAQNLNSLVSYDIVIWVEKDYSITTTQQAMLSTFIQNGGKLWFIDPNGKYSSNFNIVTGQSFYNQIMASSNNGIYLTLPNGTAFTSILSTTYNYIITGKNNFNTLLVNTNNQPVAVYGNVINGNIIGKLIYFSFEFSSIKPLYLQNFLSYHLITWFLGISTLNVNDLAVADLIVSNYHPLYHKPVNITVAIRNNGPNPLSNIPVSVYIDNQLILDSKDNSMISWTLNGGGNFTLLKNYTWIASTPGYHTLYVVVDQNNLFNEQNMNNNIITESYLFPGSINVLFSTLIVGNDTSFSNIRSLFNTFQALNYSYTFYNESSIRSNSTYPTGQFFSQYNLVIWEGGTNQYSLGQQSNSLDPMAIVNYMSNFNGSVLFMGSSIGSALQNSYYNSVLLSSRLGITLSSSYSSGSWILFGINYMVYGDPITRGMDLIYSGQMQKMSISLGYAIFDGNALSSNTPIGTIYPYYYKVYSNVQNAGIGVRGLYGQSQFAVLPLDFSGIKGLLREMSSNYAPWNAQLQAQSWLMYMMMKWYGYKDNRTQFSVSSVDIQVTGGYGNIPVVQHSYIISANVSNIGYKGQSVVVQFYQDNDIIGSQTVYIPGNSNVTVQMLWTPMFAGSSRNIMVYIDPNNQVTQINTNGTYRLWGKLFNFLNEGIRSYTVYYFWDNMNYGPGNWITSTTILNINGEGPFSFMSGTNISTDVIYKINSTLSKNYEITQNFSYSPPNSYYLREVVSSGTVSVRPPLDIAFVIDFSGSMSDTIYPATDPKYVLVQEAFSQLLFNQLTSQDRVTVFIFDYNNVPTNIFKNIATLGDYSKIYQNTQGFMYMTQGNKTILTNALNSSTPNGGTPFWSTVGLAINYVLSYSRPQTQAIRAIIALTDGDDNGVYYGNPSQNSPILTYSPLGVWGHEIYFNGNTFTGGFTKYNLNDQTPYEIYYQGTGNTNYADWYTNDYNNPDYYWFTDWYGGSFPSFYGLLFAPVPVFTIGISVSPANSLYNNTAGYNSPLNWTEQQISSLDGKSNYMGAAGDLWNMAWTTGARYFYTSTGQDLPQIFSSIVALISTSPGGSVLIKKPPTDSLASVPKPEAVSNSAGQYLIFYDGFEARGYYTNGYALDNQNYYINPNNDYIYAKGWWPTVNNIAASQSNNYWHTTKTVAYDGSYSLGVYLDSTNTAYSVWSPRILASGFVAMTVSFYIYLNSKANTATLTLTAYSPWNFNNIGAIVSNQYSSTITLNGITPNKWILESFTFNLVSPGPLPSGSIGNSADNGVIWIEITLNSGSDQGYSVYIDTFSVYGTLSTYPAYGKPPTPIGPSTGSIISFNYAKYRTLVTQPFSLVGVTSATLTFWQKYWALPGENGGIITVGTSSDGGKTWKWKYVMPTTGYSGNLVYNMAPKDSYGNNMYWCFNGASAGGTFGWEYVKVDLTPFIGNPMVAINFTFYQFALPLKQTPFDIYRGWYIDNIQVQVNGGNAKYWKLVNANIIGQGSNPNYYAVDSNPNSYFWMFNVSGSDALPLGIDSSLMTVPIDLSNARSAFLSAYFKFNLNSSAGLPPEILRVEVSTDNGNTWQSLTYGVRIGWGYSGGNTTTPPGAPPGTSYTGILSTGQPGYGWVASNTLSRLIVDLSGFDGKSIILRFRVVTNSTNVFTYASINYPKSIFIDDVSVVGESIASYVQVNYFWY